MQQISSHSSESLSDTTPIEESSQLLHQRDNCGISTSNMAMRSSEEDNNNNDIESMPLENSPPNRENPTKLLLNFILFSILFSTNHGAVVSCLSLATARFGNLGTTQNSCLYLSYTLSALFGSTYVIKTIGSYNSLIVGMVIYCIYVLSYVVATVVDGNDESWGWIKSAAIIGGGLIGGIGGGFLWTAQGTFFANQAENYGVLKYESSCHHQHGEQQQEYNYDELDDQNDDNINCIHNKKQESISEATSLFAGIFASIYLLVEVIMRLSSSFMIEVLNWTWSNVFTGYAFVAMLVTIGMVFVENNDITAVGSAHGDTGESIMESTALNDEGNYMAPTYRHHGTTSQENTPNQQSVNVQDEGFLDNITRQDQDDHEKQQSTFYKATITFRMLFLDPKMKYMIPMCAVFGLSAVFMITFVNGEVVRVSLNDEKSVYIGILSSVTSATAGILSIIFGFVSQSIGNSIILFLGCFSFFMVVFLFLVIPDLEQWNLWLLVLVYALQGIGRSTFEGALKAEFALVFTEKEGAVSSSVFLLS